MRSFDIPQHYRSPLISAIKAKRKAEDPRKKDFSPSVVDLGEIKFYLARHFGFCYGVENAIEIAYRALRENDGKPIYMLSQMIHNPAVNGDLENQGLRFIQDTHGNQLIPWDKIENNAVVIIPAFGTTLETMQILETRGLETRKYNTTCPFVEKVWKMAGKLGKTQRTIIVHGKFNHEETRATFSHSKAEAPTVVIRDISEAKVLGEIILNQRHIEDFYEIFRGRYSDGFNPESDLERIGVINQTTMLASETHEIAEYLKSIMEQKYGSESLHKHFADTRDTLCYATNDNQQATMELLNTTADLAIVVGGYNSSNTSHIKDLCSRRFTTYFINGPGEIISASEIRHYDYDNKSFETTHNYLPDKRPVEIVLTSGASCPDSVLESVIDRLCEFFPSAKAEKDLLMDSLETIN